MPDPSGFMKHRRRNPSRRPVDIRITDWREVELAPESAEVGNQAARCMDCGIPFCHDGCPLGNRIPEWNDLVRTDRWQLAAEQLHATNNFPEFTGKLCPAPCEAACVLGLIDEPVAIKQVELAIVDRAWQEGWVVPRRPQRHRSEQVAVVGSGPAGLAAAQQLTRAGYAVTVFERSDQLGGLLRYGIPEFKMEKWRLDRRLDQLRAEGTRFRTGVEVGRDFGVTELWSEADAVVLALGAGRGRELVAPGRELAGIHQAMNYLVPANRAVAGLAGQVRPAGLAGLAGQARSGALTGLGELTLGAQLDAAGKRVVIVGGGDTAADCLGTAHRQGAAEVTQLDIYPMPPSRRDNARSPWPTWPWILRTYAAHEEGGERRFAVAVEGFTPHESDPGRVGAVRIRRVEVVRAPGGGRQVVPATEETVELPADLVLLAIGFDGVEQSPLLDGLGLCLAPAGRVPSGPSGTVPSGPSGTVPSGPSGTVPSGPSGTVPPGPSGTVPVGGQWQTEVPGVFSCGDATRGASLVVWAVAEGRACAAAVDRYLSGDSSLPAPVRPGQLALRLP